MNKIKQLLSNSLLKEFSLFSSSTFVFQVSRVLVELVAAKILGPALWGIWYFLNMAIAYKGLVNLGVTNGMNREVPINLGRNEKQLAQQLQDITFTTVLFTSIISCCIFLIVALTIDDTTIRSALLCLIPLFFAIQFFQLIDTSLKAYTRFNEVSQKQLIFAVSFPLVTIPLTYLAGLEGFMIGFAVASFIAALVVYKKSSFSYSFNFNVKMAKELIYIGFPIMAVGITYAFLNTADRWIIGLMLGAKELGYYSIAIIVFGAMTLLPKLISQQLYPRMAYDWGKSGSKEDLKHWINLQTKYTAYLVAPLFITVLIVVPPVIRNWLPEYRAAILPLQIISFGPLFIPFSAGWGNLLNILDKQVYYLGVIVVAVLTNLLLNYVLVVYGFGIAGVAFGTALTFALYSIAIMYMGKYVIRKEKF